MSLVTLIVYWIALLFVSIALRSIKLNWIDRPRMAANSLRFAKEITTSQWCVIAQAADKEGADVLLQHKWWSGKKFVLFVRPHHPDIRRFKQLNPNDVVEFTSNSKPLECAFETDLCAYLRLGEVYPD